VIFVTDRSLFAGIRVLAFAGLLSGCGARNALEQPQDRTVLDISGAVNATCALRSDGTVVCWGLPFGKPIPAPFPKAVEISVGATRACARTADGHVACIGWQSLTTEPGEPTVLPEIADARQISVGASHACVVRAGGVLACWGNNTFGQLGDGTFDDAEIPVPASLGAVLAVSAGEFGTCALTEAGVHCWGRARDGQLGDGGGPHEACAPEATSITHVAPETCSPSPVLVQGLSSPRRVSAGLNGAYALDGDSRVRCWGWHSGTYGEGTSPVAIEIPGVLDATGVYAGHQRGYAIRSGGGVRSWGDNQTGALGDGVWKDHMAAIDVVGLDGAIRVTGGTYYACALRENGDVLCWGGPAGLAFGDATSENRLAPGPPVPLP
jgi:alpha-tubulin suppressor-like RCC1 family protein